uniref:Reverse transcriptase domain-containing protein n=1 Tax=Clastoptera arizonana TaxID=38151 RepID=A0A1B6C340_9HEMI
MDMISFKKTFHFILICVELEVLANFQGTVLKRSFYTKIRNRPLEYQTIKTNTTVWDDEFMPPIRHDLKNLIFFKKSDVIGYLESRKSIDGADIIEEIFTAYLASLYKDIGPVTGLNRKPFIVLESKCKEEGKKIHYMLCKKMDALCIKSPVAKMRSIVTKLLYTRMSHLKEAAVYLAMFALDGFIRHGINSDKPVIVQKGYGNISDMPPELWNEVSKKFPTELTKPDLTIYVDFNSSRVSTTTKVRNLLYSLFNNTMGPIRIIQKPLNDHEKTMDTIKNILLPHLDQNLNIVKDWY